MTAMERIAAWLGRVDGRARAGTDRGPAPEPETKSIGTVAGALVFTGQSDGIWSERSYQALARSGFLQNPVVYRSVRLIAETAAAIPILLYDGAQEIERHPLLDLLRRPNASTDGAGLIETLCGHLLLSGNAYLEAGLLDGQVRALHALRPDRIRVVEGADGWPQAYEYRVGSSVRRIGAEGEGERPGAILQVKLFHPLADVSGYPPLGAAQAALDLHNAASHWNRSLLENSARPSGALVYKPAGGNLAPEQFDRLKAELESGYVGAARAGRPMLLEGGLDWKAMALSPKDMDFIEAKNGAARDIALAFGVPPMLLAIPGDATYSNYAEANRALYRLTVLPLLNRLAGAIGDWLGGHFDLPRLTLKADLDRVDGLSAEREALWARVGGADFLTRGEKREAVGYSAEG
ncbi:phage portal protein [Jiella sp. M17.18]|uniref:phage portal protein n=1 Tax=Jiella sp. M17.18 TaxID=3234247 RepID=UPI0034DEC236